MNWVLIIQAAKHYLEHLEHIKDQKENLWINKFYRLDKALILKATHEARNRGRAEEILKQIIEEGSLDYINLKSVLLNLCDLLLTELSISGDIEVLNEIQPYITQVLDIAENNCSYSY